ncbi:ABC-type sugar transport system, ATPase component [Fagus crenata]
MILSSSPGISSCMLIHAPVCCQIDLMMLPDFPITPLAFMSWQSMRYVVVTVSEQSMEFEDLGFELKMWVWVLDLKMWVWVLKMWVWVLNLKIWVWVLKMWVSTGSGFGFRSLGFGSHVNESEMGAVYGLCNG